MRSTADMTAAIERMRQAHAMSLSRLTQVQVVDAICVWARRWEAPDFPCRREAEALTAPFPFSHVRVSLDGLLRSLTREEIHALIAAEDVREARGAAVVGHVIAGNTPLLAWVSILRALVMRSASIVKLPTGAAGAWGRVFLRSLAETSPVLASGVELCEWPGGTRELDTALCGGVDLVVANGGDEAISALRAVTHAQTPFIGYGHALSFGLVLNGANLSEAARGLARDVLLYAGGGCLSVRTVFVQGDLQKAAQFAAMLSEAMRQFVMEYGMPELSPHGWHALNNARTLAALSPGAAWFGDDSPACPVVLWPERAFRMMPGAVCVQAWPTGARFAAMLAPVSGHLQGCAVAGNVTRVLHSKIDALGVSRVCEAGQLQAAPFSWRQDGQDVLRTFLPGRA